MFIPLSYHLVLHMSRKAVLTTNVVFLQVPFLRPRLIFSEVQHWLYFPMQAVPLFTPTPSSLAPELLFCNPSSDPVGVFRVVPRSPFRFIRDINAHLFPDQLASDPSWPFDDSATLRPI